MYARDKNKNVDTIEYNCVRIFVVTKSVQERHRYMFVGQMRICVCDRSVAVRH